MNKDMSLEFYKNPGMIQRAVLQDQQDRLDGKYYIPDPRNSFMYLLSATASMTADSIRVVEDSLDKDHIRRITNMDDLYEHIPDLITANIAHQPAKIDAFKMTFHRRFLLDNACDYNSNYKKIIIPEDMVLSINGYDFSLYYPIEIIINKTTNNIVTTYNSTKTNPLCSMKNNVVESNQFTYSGMPLISLSFPVYQFKRKYIEEEIIYSQGFNKTYTFTDNYYAIRAHDIINDKLIDVTMGKKTYDLSKPTIIVSPNNENKTINVFIPQIYLTREMVSKKIELTIYTTKGKLDIDISELTDEDIDVSYAFNNRKTTKYSAILNRLDLAIYHADDDKILGGRDALTFTELKERLINGTLYSQAPVTNYDLNVRLSDKGYVSVKSLDSIDKREYILYKELFNKDSNPLALTFADIKVTKNTISNTSTIIKNSDNSLTILPDTIYELNINNNTCTPLSNAEILKLNDMSKEDLVADLNNRLLTKSPFLFRIITENRYPRVDAYNLNDPSTSNLQFIKDNYTVAAQMTISSTYITKTNTGFLLRFGMVKNEAMSKLEEDDVLVYVTTRTDAGVVVGRQATYSGTVSTLYTYDLIIDTTHFIDDRDTLSVSGFKTSSGSALQQRLPLASDFNISVYAKKGSLPNDILDDNGIDFDLLSTYKKDYCGLSRQKITCTLGEKLTDVLYTNLHVDTSQQDFLRYTQNIPYKWSSDQYEMDGNKLKIVSIDQQAGTITLNKLHSKNDIVMNGDNPKIKYPIGHIKKNNDGNPILSKDRETIYRVKSIQLDLRQYINDSFQYEGFTDYISGAILEYLEEVRNIAKEIELGRTDMFYQPIRTIGKANFVVGDGVNIKQDIAPSFKFIIYLNTVANGSDQIKELINTTVVEIVKDNLKNNILSLIHICNDIKSKLSDYVISIDSDGINGSKGLQTMRLIDTSHKLRIKNKLVYENSLLELKPDIEIVYRAM